VSVMIALRAGRSGVRMPAQAKICHFFKTSRPDLRPSQTPIQWVSRGLFLEIKRPEHEAGH
jgi:hypothetical protein